MENRRQIQIDHPALKVDLQVYCQLLFPLIVTTANRKWSLKVDIAGTFAALVEPYSVIVMCAWLVHLMVSSDLLLARYLCVWLQPRNSAARKHSANLLNKQKKHIFDLLRRFNWWNEKKLTIEMEKMIVGSRCVLLFINNTFDVRMNVGRILNTQSQSTCWTACVLFEPRLQTWTRKCRIPLVTCIQRVSLYSLSKLLMK